MSTPPAPVPAVACPSCATKLKVPAALAGKTIKCKSCGTAFKVPAAPAAAPPPPPPADAPLGFADEEEAVGQYGVQKDDLDIPRCPRCVKELDPPDTTICLHCGFDLRARRRHESRVVYELTTGDYVSHLAPGVLALVAAAAILGGAIFCTLQMRGWLTGSFLDTEEKDPITDKKKFYVEPFCFNVWILIIAIYAFWKLGKFGVRRLFIHWRPPEQVKRT